MKIVKVEVLPVKDHEIVTAVVFLQRRKGMAWEDVEEKHTVKSGTAEASRNILLDDDERLIIEGRALTQVVVDPEQSAAHEVALELAVEPPAPVPLSKQLNKNNEYSEVQEEGTSTPKSSSFYGPQEEVKERSSKKK